jgi:hypothetical protein
MSELVTVTSNTGLMVRNVNIRKADYTFLPIGEAAKAAGVINPAIVTKNGGTVTEADKKAWKEFQREYNEMKERGYKENDVAASIASREFTTRSFKLVRNKQGEVIGSNLQLRTQTVKTAAQKLAEKDNKIKALEAQIAALTVSKTDKQ